MTSTLYNTLKVVLGRLVESLIRDVQVTSLVRVKTKAWATLVDRAQGREGRAWSEAAAESTEYCTPSSGCMYEIEPYSLFLVPTHPRP